MAIPVTLFIDGTDRTDNLQLRSLSIQDDIEVRGDSVGLELVVAGSSWRPTAGNTLQINFDGTNQFFGHILAPQQELLNPNTFIYSLNAVNPVWLMDRKLIAKTYTSQLAGDMIKAIVDSTGDNELSLSADGFTYTNVEDGFTIPELTFDYVTVSNALDTIAGIIGYQWYVDQDLDIHFFAEESNTAPISEITATSTDVWDVEIVEDVSQIKNRVFIKGFSALASGGTDFDTSFTGDGISRFFPLGTGPWDSSTDSVDLQINGTAVGTQLEDGVDSTKGDGLTAADTVFVCVANWGIRFPDGSPLGSGDVLNVAIKQFEGEDQIVMVEDTIAQAAQKARENSADGVHEHLVTRPDLRAPTTSVAEEFGNLVLRRYKDPLVSGEFVTWSTGWRPGQYFDINWPERMFNGQRVFVINVTETFWEEQTNENSQYKVQFSSVPWEITV